MSPTTVLISGANRGIGKGLTERYLARDDHTVVAVVRDPKDPTSKALAALPTGQHSRLVVVKIDSTVETDALKAVDELRAQGIDRLDLVIANAGVARKYAKVSELKVADLQAHIAPNVFGVVWLFQATLPLLRASDSPKWITMGSTAGQIEEQFALPNAAYGPSKAAVHWLTKRIDGEEETLTAFVIHPGFAPSCPTHHSISRNHACSSTMSKRHWETDFTSTYHQKSYPSISPTRPELSATGKTVLVSGGGRGLGIGIVEAFAAAGAAHIIILGRNTTTLNEVAERLMPAHPSTKISTIAGDVSIESDVARAFAPAADSGGVDIVVANAGYLPAPGPIAAAAGDGDSEYTEDWWKAWKVNVKGLFLLARQFLASARGPGAVFVNISAMAAHNNPPMARFSAYSGSKIGAARVVETMQLEYPDFRFYNVHPGVVASDMLAKSGLESTQDVPYDERHFVTWLASPEGEFLKGKYLWVNWDVDELKARKEELSAPRKLVTGLLGWA